MAESSESVRRIEESVANQRRLPGNPYCALIERCLPGSKIVIRRNQGKVRSIVSIMISMIHQNYIASYNTAQSKIHWEDSERSHPRSSLQQK
jgi:hypothetical protein